LALVFTLCYKHLVPFTVKILEIVTDCFWDNMCMVLVPLVGTFFSIFYVTCLGFSVAGIIYLDGPALVTNIAKEAGMCMDRGRSDCQSASDCRWNFRSGVCEYEGPSSAWVFGLYFLFMWCQLWGIWTVYYTCYCVYAGVFARWYHKNDDRAPLCSSTLAAMRSLGSQALGGFLVAFVRTLAAVARQARRARDSGNLVCVLCACVLGTISEALEYFGEWAYVQVALRGVGLCTAARITYSAVTDSNMKFIAADLLLNSVVILGTIVVAILAGGIAFLYGWALAGIDEGYTCLAFGFLAGSAVGAKSMGILSCGVKTILTCWVDDPGRLSGFERHRGLGMELTTRRRALAR